MVDSILKRLGVFIPILLTVVLALSMVPNVCASSVIIYGDSSDGWVTDFGGINSGATVLRIGDDYDITWGNYPHHGLIKFNIAGVSQIDSARLFLYLRSSTDDGVYDNTDPLTNPGLGDCYIRHIDDYGTVDGSDFEAPSIGNNPGMFIGSTDTPNRGWIAIDITAAMQDDIDNVKQWCAFLIKFAAVQNNDLNDEWAFYSSDNSGTEFDPYIEYTFVAPVGGIYAPTDRLSILTPFIALVGLIGAVSTIFAIRRWRKD